MNKTFNTHFISRHEFTELDALPADGDLIFFSEFDSPVFVVINGEWVRHDYWQLDETQQVVVYQANSEMLELEALDEMDEWLDRATDQPAEASSISPSP